MTGAILDADIAAAGRRLETVGMTAANLDEARRAFDALTPAAMVGIIDGFPIPACLFQVCIPSWSKQAGQGVPGELSERSAPHWGHFNEFVCLPNFIVVSFVLTRCCFFNNNRSKMAKRLHAFPRKLC
jgi:hypothetical protein